MPGECQVISISETFGDTGGTFMGQFGDTSGTQGRQFPHDVAQCVMSCTFPPSKIVCIRSTSPTISQHCGARFGKVRTVLVVQAKQQFCGQRVS